MPTSSDNNSPEAWLEHARSQLRKFRAARDKANEQIEYWMKVEAKAQADARKQ